jgi:hypothetical protein
MWPSFSRWLSGRQVLLSAERTLHILQGHLCRFFPRLSDGDYIELKKLRAALKGHKQRLQAVAAARVRTSSSLLPAVRRFHQMMVNDVLSADGRGWLEMREVPRGNPQDWWLKWVGVSDEGSEVIVNFYRGGASGSVPTAYPRDLGAVTVDIGAAANDRVDQAIHGAWDHYVQKRQVPSVGMALAYGFDASTTVPDTRGGRPVERSQFRFTRGPERWHGRANDGWTVYTPQDD